MELRLCDVIRLWEEPDTLFLQYPGLLPFAALGQTDDPEATLRQTAQAIDNIPDRRSPTTSTTAKRINAELMRSYSSIDPRTRTPSVSEIPPPQSSAESNS
ncbi:hypothetical protein ACQ4M3_27005 [Leptolyngbya sp. AN03gr2]|uniref:hypothetical protein n=1 Tax=unclassified Leptolyngbya TaxID=2650499 RepID=UPI003D3187A7